MAGGVVLVLVSGCISTTTGPARYEPDDRDAAESNYHLGSQYYLRGNFERARDALNRSIEYEPRMAKAHMMLGLTYERLEVPRLAAEHHQLAVRYDPNNIDVRNAYAVFLCGQREFDKARDQFDRVARIPENDNPEVVLTNAGVCMSQQPNHEAAEAYFREALAKKNEYPEALFQMTLLKYRAGDSLSARAFLQRYLAVQPASPSVLFLAVQIEKDMGNERAQRDYTRQLIEDFPESAEARSLRETG